MTTDIKEIVPSLTAMVVVIAGMVMTYLLIRDGAISGEVGVAILTAAVTGALNFIFQDRAISKTAQAVTNGAATAAVKAAAEKQSSS